MGGHIVDIYTAHRSGTASGSCASSFGVCCIFEKTCDGGSVSQNLTYFTSSSRAVGAACELTICKCATDVCQLRLDFETFSGFLTTTPAGSCSDSFAAAGQTGKDPPTICGTNTDYHSENATL